MADQTHLFSFGRMTSVLTFQHEVALRMVAPPNNPERCRLSVMVQNWAHAEYAYNLPGTLSINFYYTCSVVGDSYSVCGQASGSCQAVIRQSSGGHQVVVRQSSGSCQVVVGQLSSNQTAIRQSSGGLQAASRQLTLFSCSRQAVVTQLSGTLRAVVRQSSGSC